MLRTANPSRYAMRSDCVGIVPEDGLGDTFKLLTCSQLYNIDLYLLYLNRQCTIVTRIDDRTKRSRFCLRTICSKPLAAVVTAANDPHNRGQK